MLFRHAKHIIFGFCVQLTMNIAVGKKQMKYQIKTKRTRRFQMPVNSSKIADSQQICLKILVKRLTIETLNIGTITVEYCRLLAF